MYEKILVKKLCFFKAQMSFSDRLMSIIRLLSFHIFIFSSKITGPISTNLCTKRPWVKRIQIFTHEGPHPLPRGDTIKIANI